MKHDSLQTLTHYLVVEDAVTDTFLLQRQIKKINDKSVISFVDSETALQAALKNFVPDIILSDFDLVDWDAFRVLEIVREHGHEIPLLVVTGNTLNQVREKELCDQGAIAMLRKDPIISLGDRISEYLIPYVEQNHRSIQNQRARRQEVNDLHVKRDQFREFGQA